MEKLYSEKEYYLDNTLLSCFSSCCLAFSFLLYWDETTEEGKVQKVIAVFLK